MEGRGGEGSAVGDVSPALSLSLSLSLSARSAWAYARARVDPHDPPRTRPHLRGSALTGGRCVCVARPTSSLDPEARARSRRDPGRWEISARSHFSIPRCDRSASMSLTSAGVLFSTSEPWRPSRPRASDEACEGRGAGGEVGSAVQPTSRSSAALGVDLPEPRWSRMTIR